MKYSLALTCLPAAILILMGPVTNLVIDLKFDGGKSFAEGLAVHPLGRQPILGYPRPGISA